MLFVHINFFHACAQWGRHFFFCRTGSTRRLDLAACVQFHVFHVDRMLSRCRCLCSSTCAIGSKLLGGRYVCNPNGSFWTECCQVCDMCPIPGVPCEPMRSSCVRLHVFHVNKTLCNWWDVCKNRTASPCSDACACDQFHVSFTVSGPIQRNGCTKGGWHLRGDLHWILHWEISLTQMTFHSLLRIGNIATKKDKGRRTSTPNAWYNSRNNVWDARLTVTAVFMFGNGIMWHSESMAQNIWCDARRQTSTSVMPDKFRSE